MSRPPTRTPSPPRRPPAGLPAWFEVDAEVARGGMGCVYRARMGGREVALKVLRPELALEGTSAARFAREIEAMRRVRHPGLVELVDAGLTQGGRPYVATEWVEGRTLAAHGPASTADARAIGLQLLDALDAAHGEGLVHRDLSPNNVLVQAEGTVKVIDFGLVASLERSLDGARWTRLTRTGFVVGTPPYAAPEHVEGHAVDARADLWAVGALLYWLISGQEVFVARTPTLTMLRVVSETARPLVERAPHASRELSLLVDRALARSPESRHASAREMRDALLAAPVDERMPEGATSPAAVTRTRRR
ncbi:MAG: serine/threonine protein kinase [Myxococcales bacterium]|nr:serine/threonine protein kinase [Myxococcales bacterium]